MSSMYVSGQPAQDQVTPTFHQRCVSLQTPPPSDFQGRLDAQRWDGYNRNVTKCSFHFARLSRFMLSVIAVEYHVCFVPGWALYVAYQF